MIKYLKQKVLAWMWEMEPSYIAGDIGNVSVPPKFPHSATIQLSNSTPRCILKRTEDVCSYKTLHMIIIHHYSSQPQSEKQMSINR
jgi:hypothetical protein